MRTQITNSPNRQLWQFSLISAGALFGAALAITITFFVIHQQKVKELSARSELISKVMTTKSLSNTGSDQFEQVRAGAKALMELKDFNSITLLSADGDKLFEFGRPISFTDIELEYAHEERWEKGSELFISQKIENLSEEPLWLVSCIDLTKADLLNLQFLLFSLLIVFGIIIFSVHFYQKLNRQIFEPLESFSQILSKQNKMKDMSPIVFKKSGVLEELAQQINESFSIQIVKEIELRRNLEFSTQELRESLETVEIHNIDLDLARKNAVELNKLKSDFLKKVSQDLRTPLNGVLNFSELLSKTPLSSEQSDYVLTIEESTKGLLTIVNDIHDFSRLESGTLQIDKKPINLRRTIEESLTLQSMIALKRGVTLYSSVDQDVPNTLLGDSLRIQQVLSNLVSNITQFDDSSYVEISVNKINQSNGEVTVKISIATNGQCPIELENWRSDEELSTKDFYSSAGMGLSVAKGIAHHMKGKIEFENSSELCSFIVYLNLGLSDDDAITQRFIDPAYQINALVFSNNDIGYREVTSRLYELGIHNKRATTFAEILTLAQKLKDEAHKHARYLPIAVIEAQTSQQALDKIVLTQTLKTLNEDFNIPTVVISPMGQYESLRKILKGIDTAVTQHPLNTSRFQKEILDQLGIVKLIGDTQQSIKNNSKAINILLVDDNSANIKLASAMLNDFNVDIKTADTGMLAVSNFEESEFDLVFMDIQLPDIDGLEATSLIRRYEQEFRPSKRTPIIALTAHNVSDEKKRLLLAGMDDFIGKPLTKKDIGRIIDRWIINTKKKLSLVSPRVKREPQANESKPVEPAALTDQSPVNISACLELAKDDPSLAYDMLTMLIDSLDEEWNGIQSAQRESNYEKMYDHVHRVHGASCYSGVPTLKNISKELDEQLRNKNLDKLDTQLSNLHEAIKELTAWASEHDLSAIFDLTD